MNDPGLYGIPPLNPHLVGLTGYGYGPFGA